MNPQQALDFIASAARKALVIDALPSYNEAIRVLAELVNNSLPKPQIVDEK